MTLKYGPLSAEQQRRLDQASFDELDQWSERLLFADNLQEVLGE